MMLEERNLSVWPFFTSILVAILSIGYGHGHECKKSCGVGNKMKLVPYPFGFSSECEVQLNCSEESGDIKIGDFQVQNLTSDSVLVYVPANCSRSLDLIRVLFGQNYAPKWKNGLLLQNCSKSLDSCVIPSKNFVSQLHIPSCNSRSDNISCYSRGNSDMDVLSYDHLNSTQCKFLFSSFAVGANSPSVSLEFERVELDWWLEGSCEVDRVQCAKKANCTDVRLGEGKAGFRCRCIEGFTGDGFENGEGCQSVSNCNASKYINGQCGGTTRVGVLVGGIIAGASLMSGLALICYFVRRRSNSWRNRLSAKRLLCEAAGNSSVPFYPYREIEKATNGFSDKQRLGVGAYGTVYAGKLHNDEWVAIKRIRHRDMDSVDQVMNEIKLLSSVSHQNLVRLLGCCIEEGEPILVYEFMPNGTLCQHLQRERGKGLPWTIRLTIAAETANAIAFLHSTMNPPIYHRDIKSSNILLDYNYRSKVADFGLSRLGMTESSHISTAPQGTPGYLDPQYHQYFHLSDKSDVYSFGVVLVEIITGLKVVDFSRAHSEVNLAALAIDRIGRGCIDEIIDPYLDPNKDAWTLSSMHNVAELAFRCLAFHRDMRPTMMEVAEELEHIRLSAWVPNMYTASPAASTCSSPDNQSERSLSVKSVKKAAIASRRLLVPQTPLDCLTTLEEVKDSSPVSVQDPWCSEQSSPSTNSLLGNAGPS
ncbi:wall-associated receptor kinase-like 14 [Mercurialis annua]|uniref:wall-associated receptor kinase-like 14 n=1 Tax=Mercurialis annua TaxID=3986 RepID=UPI0021605B9E|nr:wall-associated receptor kinase-like 14 [Mercurialis annua]XP_050205213.1 wall-associated receptor kinase-like 14 [Mercurialis annua]